MVAARQGARVVRGPGWVRAVQDYPDVGGLRSDAAASLMGVVRVLAGCARVDMTSAPTWAVLVERTGLSRRSVARYLAWLGARGLVVTVEHGSTKQFRPAPQRRRGGRVPVVVEGNRAAVYLLTAPLPEEESAPAPQLSSELARPGSVAAVDQGLELGIPKALSLREREITPARAPARARGRERRPVRWWAAGEDPQRSPAGSRCKLSGYRHEVGGLSRGAQRAADLTIAGRLRARSLDLRGISDAAVRSVIRSFLAAGWGVEDLVHAIDHTPDGARRTYTSGPTTPPAHHGSGSGPLPDLLPDAYDDSADRRRRAALVETSVRPVTHPAAWLAWRLRSWTGHTAPAAARRAAALAAAAEVRAAAAARRAAAAAEQTAAVPAPASFTAARAALRTASRPWSWPSTSSSSNSMTHPPPPSQPPSTSPSVPGEQLVPGGLVGVRSGGGGVSSRSGGARRTPPPTPSPGVVAPGPWGPVGVGPSVPPVQR